MVDGDAHRLPIALAHGAARRVGARRGRLGPAAEHGARVAEVGHVERAPAHERAECGGAVGERLERGNLEEGLVGRVEGAAEGAADDVGVGARLEELVRHEPLVQLLRGPRRVGPGGGGGHAARARGAATVAMKSQQREPPWPSSTQM